MVELKADPGHALKTDEIKAALQQHKPAVLFLCQGESSTGVQQSLAGKSAAELERSNVIRGRNFGCAACQEVFLCQGESSSGVQQSVAGTAATFNTICDCCSAACSGAWPMRLQVFDHQSGHAVDCMS